MHYRPLTSWSPHAGAVYLEGSLEEAKQLFGRLLFNDKVFILFEFYFKDN